MAIKIIKQSEGVLELTYQLPDGKEVLVSVHEDPEDGVFIGATDRSAGVLPGIWIDHTYMDPELSENPEPLPKVHVYSVLEDKEGAPVSLEFKGRSIVAYDDQDHRLSRNCPNCGGTGSEVSEGRARAGTDGVPCSRCDHTGIIDIRH